MHSLIIGSGKSFGRAVKDRLVQQGHCVWQVGSQADDDRSLSVDWAHVDIDGLHKWLKQLPDLDVIFFNQNGSSLSPNSFDPGCYTTMDLWRQVKHWRHSHWTSCELPFFLIHTLTAKIQPHTRVVWMLSELIFNDSVDYKYPDYVANKFQNLLIMKNFAEHHPGCFFAVEPGDLNQRMQHKVDMFAVILERPDTQGKVFNLDSGECHEF